MVLQLKRVYEKPSKSDGYRILVDRLWARGLTKQKAKLNLWLKEIAPSNELRKWYGHDPARWKGFTKKYLKELKQEPDLVGVIKAKMKEHKTVTLVYGSKSPLNNADGIVPIFEKERGVKEMMGRTLLKWAIEYRRKKPTRIWLSIFIRINTGRTK